MPNIGYFEMMSNQFQFHILCLLKTGISTVSGYHWLKMVQVFSLSNVSFFRHTFTSKKECRIVFYAVFGIWFVKVSLSFQLTALCSRKNTESCVKFHNVTTSIK